MLAAPAAAQTPTDQPNGYAGKEICRGCHPGEFSGHSQSGHARSLFRKGEHPRAGLFSGVEADWAFGAGTQAVTFVRMVDEDYYLELGLSWYRATGRLALTPGHRTAEGERYRTFDPDAAILRCFQCHSTGMLRLREAGRVEPRELGVQCEACHGPGAEHAARRGSIKNPGKMSAAELNDACGACHRKPAAAGSDTDWSNPWNTRHQPLYLAESKCFTSSKGALSCRSCHPAHQALSLAAGDYDARCVGCHGGVKHRTAVVTGRSCAGCHMPAVEPRADLRFTNHWIGVYAAGRNLRPVR